MFIAATRHGRLDVAAVLSSLYPASTVILARVLLKERISRMQTVGIAGALICGRFDFRAMMVELAFRPALTRLSKI